ncbi:MAG: hydroxymethylpyrimidine/phosphomethylpyrimidine kinase [Gammaproteobacteria bacterium]|nr:hydroxymethylpyrimidine/phosphomethylpyrimidine kinase [Gammaproteobacteria bacterium]MCP5137159.1 hydroxymethylpyrimidine/phosphomethylpyrimidine kinase [Gammaproteobacteria bacterium]
MPPISTPAPPPTVLVLSGLDPTGGAGLQADIEALISMGCHPLPLVTSLTTQDTHNVFAIHPTDPAILQSQAQTLLADIAPQAIKVGLIGDAAVARSVVQIIRTALADNPYIPVVIDPILAAGGGAELAGDSLIEVLREQLLPLTTVLTPNLPEARRLTDRTTVADCATCLLDMGCEFVLLTGAHDDTEQVENHLYGEGRRLDKLSWPRLPGSYHGSGCTLASALTGLLAHGQTPLEASYEAQHYTWQTLNQAQSLGGGQAIPNRLFWTSQREPTPCPP